MNIRIILDSIIPDNIKNIPLIQKSMDVFSELLERNSTISQRISNLYSIDRVSFLRKDKFGNVTEVSDSDFLTNTKNNLKNALFDLYLNVLYHLFHDIQTDANIREATYKRSFSNTLINKNIHDILTSEYLGAFRFFQQNVGNKSSIRYIYQLAKYIETGYIYDDLDIDEDGTFSLKYSGTLHKYYFSKFNQPLSHPCGWCYEYETILDIVLSDYFGVVYNPDGSWSFTYEDDMYFDNTIELDGPYRYLKNDYNKAFKLSSGAYPYTPGYDESIYQVTNYTPDNLNSYNLKFRVNVETLTYVRVGDSNNHHFVETTNGGDISVCTHGWYGDTVRVDILNSELNLYFIINKLNKISSDINITSIYMNNGSVVIDGTSSASGTYTLRCSNTTDSGTFNPNIHIVVDLQGSDEFIIRLSNTHDTVNISTNCIRYPGTMSIPRYTDDTVTSITTIISPNDMDTLTTPKLSSMRNGRTFVNNGYSRVTVNSSNCYVVDSTVFTSEDFDIEVVPLGSYLTCSNSKDEGSFTDNKFLTVYTDDKERREVRGMVGCVLSFLDE